MSEVRKSESLFAFRNWLALKIAPWLFVPYPEHREEAFKMLAHVAYGSRDAVWTSPTTLARVAMDQKWADGYKERGDGRYA